MSADKKRSKPVKPHQGEGHLWRRKRAELRQKELRPPRADEEIEFASIVRPEDTTRP